MTHWTDTFATRQTARRMHGRAGCTTSHAPASVMGKVIWAVNRAVRILFVWQERSRGRFALAQLDERMLRDIGLSRVDALREASKPFWRQ
ncbi:MAG: DUF1127 domain-containing protein [Alphaproteobacteria bacterium]|nr:DUF1127 domain-containing protein [Alphaproteobacteria bacterium]